MAKIITLLSKKPMTVPNLRCSFCGRPHPDVPGLLTNGKPGAENVNICTDCVAEVTDRIRDKAP